MVRIGCVALAIGFVALAIGLIAVAGAPAARPDPDGRYRGTHVGKDGQKLTQTVTFRVSHGGRRIRRLRTTAATLCVGPTLFDNRIFIAAVYLPSVVVAPNGRFRGVRRRAGHTRFAVSGRRRGRRVKGRLEVRIANCSARARFVARRVRRR